MIVKYLHTFFALIIFNLAFCTGVFCQTAVDSVYNAPRGKYEVSTLYQIKDFLINKMDLKVK